MHIYPQHAMNESSMYQDNSSTEYSAEQESTAIQVEIDSEFDQNQHSDNPFYGRLFEDEWTAAND